MRLALARLRFAHRWLWERDETYRLAAVLGPPVLLGLALAVGATAEYRQVRAGTAPPWLMRIARWPGWSNPLHPTGAAAPWARPAPSVTLPQDGTPTAIAPTEAMPPDGPAATLARLKPGWAMAAVAVTGPSDYQLDFADDVQAIAGPSGMVLDMAALPVASLPPGAYGLVAAGILLVREPGRYALSLRLSRPPSVAPATCVMKVKLDERQALAEGDLGLEGGRTHDLAPVIVDLQAGFYRLQTAFGCWHSDVLTGRGDAPGTLEILLRRPGQLQFGGLQKGEIFHQPLAN